jgi:signal transduction histidine kinase
MTGFPYLRNNGDVIGSVGIAMEITELMNTQLLLQKKVAELNTFFYKTSHDFKTPIASLQGLLECYSEKDDPAEFVHYVKLCTEKLNMIVNRVSQISVIQQKKIILEEIVIESVLDEILKELKTENVQFASVKFVYNSDFTTIVSERFLLKIILKNLLDNSIRFLNSDQANPEIKLHFGLMKNFIVISVKDNGPGIDEISKDKVFDMFYRGSDRSKGPGLGLYIVKSAVEKLGGSIQLQDEIKEGSEFRIILPMVLPD